MTESNDTPTAATTPTVRSELVARDLAGFCMPSTSVIHAGFRIAVRVKGVSR